MVEEYDVLSEVIPGRLYLSSLEIAKNESLINEFNIDIIVSIINKDPFKKDRPETYKDKQLIYFYAEDNDNFPIEQYFDIFNKLMELNPCKRILVHCLIGMSRSATLVLSYLIKRDLYANLIDHYMYLKEIRSCIDPNIGFFNKLRSYRHSLKESRGKSII